MWLTLKNECFPNTQNSSEKTVDWGTGTVFRPRKLWEGRMRRVRGKESNDDTVPDRLTKKRASRRRARGQFGWRESAISGIHDLRNRGIHSETIRESIQPWILASIIGSSRFCGETCQRSVYRKILGPRKSERIHGHTNAAISSIEESQPPLTVILNKAHP